MSDQEIEGPVDNVQLLLICGLSGDGKSASLRHLENQEDWMYLNCESNKRLPFKNKFRDGGYPVTDPYQVWEAFEVAKEDDSVKGVIIDSVTFLMDMFESQYVLGSADTMKGWSNYAQFFKTLMQKHVAELGKPVIIIAHILDTLDEAKAEMKTSVPIKGSLKNNGLEAYFSTVVIAKKVSLKELDKYGSKMLEITEDEKELGFKHVFQTRVSKQTLGTRIRSPMGMFSKAETYIDNDAQKLLDHLNEFYNN